MSEKNSPKKSWAKRILKFFAWLIAIIIVLIIAIYMSLNIIVKKVITTAVPPITGTSVTIDDVDLALLKGHIALKGFQIANPDGFATPSIFSLGSIVIEIDVKSVLTDKIIIKKIAIDSTTASAEINKNGDINIMLLQQNVQNYLNKSPTTPAPVKEANKPAPAATGKSKTVIIKELNINNTKLNLGIVGQVITITLPNIHKTGIGEEKGKSKTLPETIALILSYFSEASLTGIAQSGNQIFMQGLENTKEMLNQGREALNKQLDNAKHSTENIKKIGSDVEDSIKGLGNMFK